MAQGSVTTFEEFRLAIAEKKHQFNTDTHKVILVNAIPAASQATPVLADFTGVTECANGGGYTTGGVTAAISVAEVGGTATFTLDSDVTWTAQAGSPTDIKAAVFYSDTATNDDCFAFVDMTTDAGTTPISLVDGNITIGAGTIFTLA